MAELGWVGACANDGKQGRGKEVAGGCFGSHLQMQVVEGNYHDDDALGAAGLSNTTTYWVPVAELGRSGRGVHCLPRRDVTDKYINTVGVPTDMFPAAMSQSAIIRP